MFFRPDDESHIETKQRESDDFSAKERFFKFFTDNSGKILGGAAGLIIAVLFMTAGFWKTILITGCVLMGGAIGGRKDRYELLKRFYSRGKDYFDRHKY